MTEQFPQSSFGVIKAKQRFDLKFGSSKDNMYRFLIQNIPQYKRVIDSVSQMLHNRQLLHFDANETIADLDKRTQFNIDEPFLSTLSYFQFNGDYTREFNNEHTYTYNSKGNEKAKGVNISLKLPLSWRQHTGDRPNIIQKFTPAFDTHHPTCMLQVKDIDTTVISLSDIFNSEGDDLLGKGSVITNKYEITIDGCPGFFIEFTQNLKRLQYNFTILNRMYIFQYGAKICSLDITMYLTDDAIKINKHKQICDLIASSIVVNNKWKAEF